MSEVDVRLLTEPEAKFRKDYNVWLNYLTGFHYLPFFSYVRKWVRPSEPGVENISYPGKTVKIVEPDRLSV